MVAAGAGTRSASRARFCTVTGSAPSPSPPSWPALPNGDQPSVSWFGRLAAVADRLRCVGELPDDPGEPGGLVQRDEGVTVVDLGQLSLREELGQAPAVLGWHHPVLAGPDDESG